MQLTFLVVKLEEGVPSMDVHNVLRTFNLDIKPEAQVCASRGAVVCTRCEVGWWVGGGGGGGGGQVGANGRRGEPCLCTCTLACGGRMRQGQAPP